MVTKLFSELENFLNEKIPSDINHILQECAFDIESSLQAIDAEVIADIESHVNGDREILKNSSFENVNPSLFSISFIVFSSNNSKLFLVSNPACSSILSIPTGKLH